MTDFQDNQNLEIIHKQKYCNVKKYLFVQYQDYCSSSLPLYSCESFFTSSGSLKKIIMQVILSVPVPSDNVMSPFAIP